jgi:hypothetical protein
MPVPVTVMVMPAVMTTMTVAVMTTMTVAVMAATAAMHATTTVAAVAPGLGEARVEDSEAESRSRGGGHQNALTKHGNLLGVSLLRSVRIVVASPRFGRTAGGKGSGRKQMQVAMRLARVQIPDKDDKQMFIRSV